MFPTLALFREPLVVMGKQLPRTLQVGGFVNARVIKDYNKRQFFAEYEEERNALKYVARNTTLPLNVRMKAQMELNDMHCWTRRTQIKNRCVMSGRGRGVFREFRMCRYQFRMNALAGTLPGVKKASW